MSSNQNPGAALVENFLGRLKPPVVPLRIYTTLTSMFGLGGMIVSNKNSVFYEKSRQVLANEGDVKQNALFETIFSRLAEIKTQSKMGVPLRNMVQATRSLELTLRDASLTGMANELASVIGSTTNGILKANLPMSASLPSTTKGGMFAVGSTATSTITSIKSTVLEANQA